MIDLLLGELSATKSEPLNELKLSLKWENSRRQTVTGTCPLDNLLLFHGRDEGTIQFLRETFETNLKRAQQLAVLAANASLYLTNGSVLHDSSNFHLFQCEIKPLARGICSLEVNRSACAEDILSVLSNAGPKLDWLETWLSSEAVSLVRRLEEARLKITAIGTV